MTGSDEDQWFDDYDEPMSDGEDGDAYPSDSEAGGRGGSSSSGGAADGFEDRGTSEARSELRNRLYSVIDRQNLRRMQVGAATEIANAEV